MDNRARDHFSAKSKGFGLCLTDRTDNNKDPRVMKEKIASGGKRVDHFTNPATRQYTQAFFNMFELPMPPDDLIHRGNSQDLTFRPHEGLVIRTGPMDIADMIHPGVLQPLYWMPFQNTNHVVGVYPGIQLPDVIFDPEQSAAFESDRDRFLSFMKDTGQFAKDGKTPHNYGYVGDNIVMLDTEHFSCGTRDRQKKSVKPDFLQHALEEGRAPHAIMRDIMTDMYADHPEFEMRIRAYDYHQPLRIKLQEAINTDDPQAKRDGLSAFYYMCAQAVTKGADSDSGVALYSPWTGKAEDNKPKPSATSLTP